MAGALYYAHERKIIHRDVKPDNMLISENGQIMLGDFGIAAIAHNTSSQRMESVMGTITYMAPEQIQGFPRPSSDQYALGIITYEWLCGQRPFQGSFAEIAAQHTSASPPSLRQRLPTISMQVEQVITKALAKDLGERFSTIEEFAGAFIAAARQQTFVSQNEGTASQLYTGKIEPTRLAPPIHSSVLQKNGEDVLTSTVRAHTTYVTDTDIQARPDKKLRIPFSKGTLYITKGWHSALSRDACPSTASLPENLLRSILLFLFISGRARNKEKKQNRPQKTSAEGTGTRWQWESGTIL